MSACLRYQLKQSFIDYFHLNQIDNTVYHSQLHEYLVKKIMESSNPQEKALEIWNTFVTPMEENMCEVEKTRIKQYKKDILKRDNIHYTLNALGCIGVSPFCNTRVVGL
jgi:hypothetical protein